MNVHTLTRRAHGNKPGDESIHFIGEPVELDLEPIRSEWSSPSRLHIPRQQYVATAFSGKQLLWVAVAAVAVIALVVAV